PRFARSVHGKADYSGGCRLLTEGGYRLGRAMPVVVDFDRFLPFGLTLSLSPPTVTVRNRYRKRRLAGETEEKCHLSTLRHWARDCAPFAPSRDCLCTALRRSPAAGGRPLSSAPTSAATGRSRSRSSPSLRSSTAFLSPSCCPATRRRLRSRRHPSSSSTLSG